VAFGELVRTYEALQRFVDADFEQHYFTLYEDEATHPQLQAADHRRRQQRGDLTVGGVDLPVNDLVAPFPEDAEQQEGVILRYVFWHSIVLACLVGVLVFLQAYVFPWMIPTVDALAK